MADGSGDAPAPPAKRKFSFLDGSFAALKGRGKGRAAKGPEDDQPAAPGRAEPPEPASSSRERPKAWAKRHRD